MSTLERKRRRDLWLRKWQFGATAATILLGTLAYAASYDAYRNLDASYRDTYERLRLADVTVTGADDAFPATMQGFRSVATVERRLQAEVPLRVDGGHTFLGRVVGIPADRAPRLNQLDLFEGSRPPRDRTDGALVETHMFDFYEMAPGDTVELHDGTQWRALEVFGSAFSPEYVWPARSAQDVLSTPDSFGVLFVDERVVEALPASSVQRQYLVGYARGAHLARADALAVRTARRAGATTAVLRADQPSNKALQADVLGFRQMAYAFPALFLVAAGMATYTLMSRLVLQERELIGTLRANGLSRGGVVRHYLSYGAWIGVVAGLPGVALGIPLGWLMTAAYTRELGVPVSVRELHATTIVVGLLFGPVTGLLSAWLPARAAARLEPAEAMRGDIATVVGHRSPLERLVPVLALLPARRRMVVRGIARNRRRSASTVLGVVLALVLLMAAWGLLDSVNYLMSRQFGEIQHDDASVSLVGRVDEDAVARIAGVEGVRSAERVIALAVSVKAGGGTYATELLAFEPATRMHDFDVDLPVEGVLLGTQLRDELEVETGDSVAVAVPALQTRIAVRVAGFVDEPVGTFAYMQRGALVAALTSAPEPVDATDLSRSDTAMVLVRFDADAERERVLRRLERLDGVAAVRDAQAFIAWMDEYLALFYAFVGIMLAFGGLLAFTLMFTTVSANTAERAGELAIMRANGFSRRQVTRLVAWENVLLTAIGIPLGLVAGYVVVRALLASWSTDMFAFALHISPFTYVWCAAAMLGVTLLALWPSVHLANRMDIAAIVRQRSL